MKKTAIFTLCFAFLGTAQAGNNFEGSYAGVTLGSYSGNLDLTTASGVKLKIGEDGRDIGFGGVLGYGRNFQSFNFGVEAQYQQNLGSVKLSEPDSSISGQINDAWNISFLPGFVASPETLVYGRLGVGNINTEVTRKTSTASETDTESMDALVLGLGVKHLFTDTISGSFEYKQLSADKTIVFSGSSFKSEVTSSGLEFGLQYKF